MNRKKLSITSKILIIVISVLLLSNGVFCLISIMQSREAIKVSIRQRMLDIVNCASGAVDGNMLKDIEFDPDSPEYQAVYNELAVYRDNVELEYVYAIRDVGNYMFEITVDPTIDDPGYFGEKIISTEALIIASKGTAAVDAVSYTDRWGSFYSAYSPVFDSDGNVAGIIAVDFTKEWYESQLRGQTRLSMLFFLFTMGATIVIAVFICLIWVKTITDPLKRMTDVAGRYAMGEYDEEMPEVKTEDEIGILSRSLDTMAKSLTEQIQLAESANEAKSNFLANMSHEMRTPINVILGLNEMIRLETAEEKTRNFALDIRDAGRNLLALINGILDFSKIEDGKMEILHVSYDVALFINNLVNSVSQRAHSKGLELHLYIDRDLPAVLRGDEVRVSQIIMNLLTNAVKYTEKGSIDLTINGGARDDGRIELYVEVKDTGIGIRPEDIDKLAQSFTRIEEERNRHIEGTGLGIAIVTRLLDMMGSSLDIKSTYGEGSVFSFHLWQEIVDDIPVGDYKARIRESRSRMNEGVYPVMKDARILVVDDYETNLKVMDNFLNIFGIKPDLVSSGKEALEKLKDNRYDIIFLDHMMPDMDGIETLHKIREMGLAGDDTSIIVITANAVSGVREQYMETGFDDYVSKPIDMAVIRDVLVAHLPEELISYEERKEIMTESETGHGNNMEGTVDDDVILEFAPKSAGGAVIAKKADGSGESKKVDIEAVKKQSEPVPAENMEERLREAGISMQDGMKFCGGKFKLYHELLTDFYINCEKRCSDLDSYYDRKEWALYQILVHAHKSNAGMLGAARSSAFAKALEDAIINEDEEYINANHRDFVNLYKTTADAVGRLL